LVEGWIETDGKTGIVIRAMQHTADSTAYNDIRVMKAADGTNSYSMTDPAAFRSALGGVPLIKTATISWTSTNSYTYSDSWVTSGTAIVATDLQYRAPVT
jgi:hypothetical protein